MQVWLYKRTQDVKYIAPKLPAPRKISDCTFKEDGALNITNPTVICDVSGVDDINDFNGYNYMYIPQLKSYYWITWYTEGGLIVIEGERDPFKTFWDSIKKSSQYVTRQEHRQNGMIVDNRLVMHSDNIYDAIPFGDPVFDKHCVNVILETIGTGAKGSD
jgi:hypothetical protein